MEHVDGVGIDKFIGQSPERTNEVFIQTISGFAHLEAKGILHRDVRPGNVMVRSDGTVKITDLGFGKQVRSTSDFDKSITLNWWCQTPEEFSRSRYDFKTEVYFVGKLFEQLIREKGINHFKYSQLLGRMCQHDPGHRVQAFADVDKEIRSNQFQEIEFTEDEAEAYRAFSNCLAWVVTKIEHASTYEGDPSQFLLHLNEVYRSFMLEQEVPDAAVVTRCIIKGNYYARKRGMDVSCVKDFIGMFRAATEEKRRIILLNLHKRLDSLVRYDVSMIEPGEIPF